MRAAFRVARELADMSRVRVTTMARGRCDVPTLRARARTGPLSRRAAHVEPDRSVPDVPRIVRSTPALTHGVLASAVLSGLRGTTGLVLAPMPRGVATHRDEDSGREWRVRYGWLDGCSDLLGWVQCAGLARVFAIEIKVGRDRERPNQAQFRRLVNSAGGYACIVHARDANDVPSAVDRARAHAAAAASGDSAPE